MFREGNIPLPEIVCQAASPSPLPFNACYTLLGFTFAHPWTLTWSCPSPPPSLSSPLFSLPYRHLPTSWGAYSGVEACLKKH